MPLLGVHEQYSLGAVTSCNFLCLCWEFTNRRGDYQLHMVMCATGEYTRDGPRQKRNNGIQQQYRNVLSLDRVSAKGFFKKVN